MSGYGPPPPSGRKTGLFRRVARYAIFLLVWWILLVFVVIPWDTSSQIPQDSYDLIEAQRAYAELTRRQRPNLVTVLRGLHLVRSEYTHVETENGRRVTFGNVQIDFDAQGEFLSLRLLR